MPISDRDRGKAALQAVIDHRMQALRGIADDIEQHPELGFKEHRTAAVVADALRNLGLEPTEGLAITGVRADVDLGRPGPTVAIFGELDALPVPDHPHADPSTGAAHACGHHLQIAHLLGIATALTEVGARLDLAGRVALIAVPAEEYVDLGWRYEEVKAGRLHFASGKQELLAIGAIDDVDIAMMVHASARSEDRALAIRHGNNGFVAKQVEFVGRSAHAAAGPHLGVNALTAARLAMQAIDAQREAYPADARVRVHGVITDGGGAPNVVPDKAALELFVRAADRDAIRETASKVDHAFRAGAMAIGAQVRIDTIPGYLPVVGDPTLEGLFRDNAQAIVGLTGWADQGPLAGSTDMGDISHVMPAIHPYHGGCAGANHGPRFEVVDHDIAIGAAAKAMLGVLVDLLADDARTAREVIDGFVPTMSRESYLADLRDGAGSEVWSA